MNRHSTSPRSRGDGVVHQFVWWMALAVCFWGGSVNLYAAEPADAVHDTKLWQLFAEPRGQSPGFPSNESDGDPGLIPGFEFPSDLMEPAAPEQKFPSPDDAPSPELPGGAWSFLDPKFIGPDGTPGFRPWLMTFLTARTLPGYKADIKEPGPDSANFPNSAFTLPPGEVYIETSPITYQQNPFLTRRRIAGRADQYSLPTLVRIGAWKDFELRYWSQTAQWEKFGNQSEFGFGPLLLDSKFHFWDQDKEKHIPAFGIQLMTQTPWGSSVYSIPNWEPAFSLNFDYELESGYALEWNVGGTWTVDETGKRIYQGNFTWSIQKELTPSIDWFVHGYLNVPGATQFQEGGAVGAGLIWFVTKQIAIDGNYAFPIKIGSPDALVRLGLSIAL